MLRILHTADVHLGARHTDLGERATAQRERQFAAFARTVQAALDRDVHLFLVAGDLFDSNTQPRRTVERVAAELRRLAAAGIRTVLLPGTHDVYDRASVYRAHDLPALAGLAPGSDQIVVLTPDRPDVVYPALDAIVYGRIFATKRAPQSPLAGLEAGDRSACPLEDRDGPRLRRDPGLHGRRRRRHHAGRDRALGPRLPRARPLALDSRRAARAGRSTRTRARRSRWRSTRIGRAARSP